jgi:sortase (surface protein transpeptidase)
MHKLSNKESIIKATIKHIIVAFIYAILLVAIVYIPFSGTISRAISLIDMITIETNKTILKDVKIDLKNKRLSNYPAYGARYGTIMIPTLGVNLPLYFGDTLEILKNGIGHSCYSYFPGEGGTILCLGHNTFSILRKLPEIEKNAQIIIETT